MHKMIDKNTFVVSISIYCETVFYSFSILFRHEKRNDRIVRNSSVLSATSHKKVLEIDCTESLKYFGKTLIHYEMFQCLIIGYFYCTPTLAHH